MRQLVVLVHLLALVEAIEVAPFGVAVARSIRQQLAYELVHFPFGRMAYMVRLQCKYGLIVMQMVKLC